MTLPRYEAICDAWERVPPLAVSVWAIAQGLGAKEPAKRAKRAKTAEAEADPTAPREDAGKRQELLDLFGGIGGLSVTRRSRDG